MRKAKWNLTLPLSEARKNDEVISLSDSQMLRWIDELNGIENSDFIAKKIKKSIKMLKKEPNSLQNRREIKKLYEKLDKVQHKPDYWYRYMTTCTIFNSWDTAAHALNGMDKDGDLVLLTDNKVLVNNYRPLPAIMCAQRNAAKVEVSEELLIQSNIDSFGDEIGKTTNWITTMFDVQSQFPIDSEEYRVLDYRIKCGQLYQQNSIDKAKGIIAKPMPKDWYDRSANRITEDLTEEEIARRVFNIRILADKKPYFMRYIYPNLMSQYNTYIISFQIKPPTKNIGEETACR